MYEGILVARSGGGRLRYAVPVAVVVVVVVAVFMGDIQYVSLFAFRHGCVHVCLFVVLLIVCM